MVMLSMFLAYVAIYSQRSHLGITLIAMLNSTFVVHHQQQFQQLEAEVNLTRRRADCRPFPRRDDDVRVACIIRIFSRIPRLLQFAKRVSFITQ